MRLECVCFAREYEDTLFCSPDEHIVIQICQQVLATANLHASARCMRPSGLQRQSQPKLHNHEEVRTSPAAITLALWLVRGPYLLDGKQYLLVQPCPWQDRWGQHGLQSWADGYVTCARPQCHPQHRNRLCRVDSIGHWRHDRREARTDSCCLERQRDPPGAADLIHGFHTCPRSVTLLQALAALVLVTDLRLK